MIGMSSSSASTTIITAVSGWNSKNTIDATTSSMMSSVIATR